MQINSLDEAWIAGGLITFCLLSVTAGKKNFCGSLIFPRRRAFQLCRWKLIDTRITAHASGSSVNNSWGCETPRSAYLPTETRLCFISQTFANAAEVSIG